MGMCGSSLYYSVYSVTHTHTHTPTVILSKLKSQSMKTLKGVNLAKYSLLNQSHSGTNPPYCLTSHYPGGLPLLQVSRKEWTNRTLAFKCSFYAQTYESVLPSHISASKVYHSNFYFSKTTHYYSPSRLFKKSWNLHIKCNRGGVKKARD